ncbi:HigA family addiction module antidote protein [Candidatus Sumerlaeota bacterium]|nr:HigA family addiction module antidote protein [Candidatus Sumerlaeota bacterium]
MSKNARIIAVSPGEIIRDELDERGWTQADLARITGRSLAAINEVVTGKRGVSPQTALELGEAFGTSPEFWMNIESAYRLSLVDDPKGRIRARAQVYEIGPIKEMMRRRWIKTTSNTTELEDEVRRFFHLASVNDKPRDLAMAARTSLRPGGGITPAQRAWAYRAAHLAREVRAAKFSEKGLLEGLDDLKKLAAFPEEIRKVPGLLSSMGIRFLVIEHLRGTRIDGASFWLDKDTPVIVVSMRYDRIDWFWHTLFHEISHIRHHDTGAVSDGREILLDTDLVGEDAIGKRGNLEMEARADEEAAASLISKKDIESFILRVRPFYSKTRIIQFAHRTRIHPGIIVGQLQNRGEIGYSANREMLVKVKHLLLEEALTDGWAKVVAA